MRKALGYYLSWAAALLALVSLFLYRGIAHEHAAVRPLLIACAAVAVILLGLATIRKRVPGADLVPVINAVLSLVSLGLAAWPMATLIVYAFIGMNEMSTIRGFLSFMIAVLAAWLLNVIAAFCGVMKQE